MAKKYTVLINDENVIKKLDSLPQRGKGLYISQAIEEKIIRDNGIILDEQKIVEIVKTELDKRLIKQLPWISVQGSIRYFDILTTVYIDPYLILLIMSTRIIQKLYGDGENK